ncbi:MAG: DUF4403 family protein [Synergistaceae bacterium]|nr:DUF4403 family protein [Synergistaceae bacterium]
MWKRVLFIAAFLVVFFAGAHSVLASVVMDTINAGGEFASTIYYNPDLEVAQFKGFVSLFPATISLEDGENNKKAVLELYGRLAHEFANNGFFVLVVGYQDDVSANAIDSVIQSIRDGRSYNEVNRSISEAMDKLKPEFLQRYRKTLEVLSASRYNVYQEELPHYMSGGSLGVNMAFLAAGILPPEYPLVFMNFASAFAQSANLDLSISEGLEKRLIQGISFHHSSGDRLTPSGSVKTLAQNLMNRGIDVRVSVSPASGDVDTHAPFIVTASLPGRDMPSPIVAEILEACGRYAKFSGAEKQANEEKKSIRYGPEQAAIALNMASFSTLRIVNAGDEVTLTDELNFILNNLRFTDLPAEDELIGIYTNLLELVASEQLTDLNIETFYGLDKRKPLNLADAAKNMLSKFIYSGGESEALFEKFARNAGENLFSYYFQKLANDEQKLQYIIKAEKIANIKSARQKFMEAYWRIFQKYGIADSARLSERTANDIMTALDVEDPEQALRLLEPLSEDCGLYPPYLFYRGLKAYEAAEKLKRALSPGGGDDAKITEYHRIATRYYKLYEEEYKAGNTLLRNDYLYAESLKHRLSYEPGLSDRDVYPMLTEMRKNLNPNDSDGLILAAAFYFMKFSDISNAAACLQTNIDRGQQVADCKALLELIKNTGLSFINVPVVITSEDLYEFLADQIPSEFSGSGDEHHIRYRYKVPLSKARAELLDGEINCIIPVEGWFQLYKRVFIKIIRHSDDVALDLTVGVSPSIDSSWIFSPNLRLKGHVWTDPPRLGPLGTIRGPAWDGFSINIKILGIRAQFRGLRVFADGAINDINNKARYDLSPIVEEAWKKGFDSLKLGDYRLHVIPKSLSTKPEIDKDLIRLNLTLGAHLNVDSQEPQEYEVLPPLPSNDVALGRDTGIILRAPVKIKYADIETKLTEMLKDSVKIKGVSFDHTSLSSREGARGDLLVGSVAGRWEGKIPIKFKLWRWTFTLWENSATIPFELEMAVAPMYSEGERSLYLYVDSVNSEVLSKEMSEGDIKEIAENYPMILALLEKRVLAFNVGEVVQEEISNANELLAKLNEGAVTVTGRLADVRFSGLKIDREGINLNMLFSGNLAVKIDPLRTMALWEVGDKGINYQDKLGRTQLMKAILRNDHYLIDAFLGKYPEFELHADLLEKIVKQPVSIDIQDNDGRTALMLAASENLPDAAKTIAGSSDLTLADKDGMTPLMLAAAGNKPDFVEMFIAGSDLAQKDNSGRTALIMALESENRPVLEVFRAHNVKLAEPWAGSQKLIDRAAANDDQEMLNLLEDLGLYSREQNDSSEDN